MTSSAVHLFPTSNGAEVYTQARTLIYVGRVADADGIRWNAYDVAGDLVGNYASRQDATAALLPN